MKVNMKIKTKITIKNENENENENKNNEKNVCNNQNTTGSILLIRNLPDDMTANDIISKVFDNDELLNDKCISITLNAVSHIAEVYLENEKVAMNLRMKYHNKICSGNQIPMMVIHNANPNNSTINTTPNPSINTKNASPLLVSLQDNNGNDNNDNDNNNGGLNNSDDNDKTKKLQEISTDQTPKCIYEYVDPYEISDCRFRVQLNESHH